MANRGLFDLAGLESMGDNDMMNLPLNESSEFVSNDPSTNRPETDFDTDTTAAKKMEISVPGGYKETPTAKPEGGEKEVPVPGGDKESPSAHAVDGAKIGTPAKVVLSQDTYNSALAALKKSFKEGVEIMEMLESATIQTQTVDELQEEFTENAINDILLESFENGPYFEKVDKSDKHDIKSIVKKIRNDVGSSLSKDKVKFEIPNVWVNLLAGIGASALVGAGVPLLAQTVKIMFKSRLWQILGLAYVESGNIDHVAERLNKEFAEQLGEFKVLPVRVPSSIIDIVFRNKFGWKNHRRVFLLLVDKKLPSELEGIADSFESDFKKANKESGSDNKSDDKKDEK